MGDEAAPLLVRMRCYLRAVYPAGRWASAAESDDATVAAIFCSRQSYYVMPACNASLAAGSASTGGEVATRRPSRRPRIDWPAGCATPGGTCATTHATTPIAAAPTHPPSSCCIARVVGGVDDCGVADASGARGVIPTGSEAGEWIEVGRTAFNGCKGVGGALCAAGLSSLAEHGWFDVLDDGASGFWYVVSPGSGIWYATGRSLRVRGKLSAMVVMLAMWVAQGEDDDGPTSKDASGVVDVGLLVSELARVCGPRCANASTAFAGLPTLRDMLWSLERKETTCAALGWDESVCAAKYDGRHELHLVDTLDDRWDGLMLGLARVLGYDSLLTTDSDDVLIDLRAPRTPAARTWLRTMHRFGFAYKWPPVGFKKRWPVGERVADEWAAHVQAQGTLTLRDPLRVADDAAARPCAFDLAQPTIRLACVDHVSWTGRAQARYR